MTNIQITDAAHNLAELVNQIAKSHQPILLTSDGQTKAVLLSIEAFEELVKIRQYRERELIPLDKFQVEFKQALVEAGYDSREKIVNLVQEVKQQMAAEREHRTISQE